MNDKTLIYELMYQAFLDIRSAAYEEKPYKGIFRLANVFHNVPLQLVRVEESKGCYADIVNDIRIRAARDGCSSWLDNAIEHLTRRYP